MALPSPPSPLSRNSVYDVFPSFSSEDVPETFLTHFFKELDRKLIIAFKYNENKRKTSLDRETRHAIRFSRIAVVVLTEEYASSSRCLDELAEIVKCKEKLGQLVIPIFYGLDQSHVRYQTGKFGDGFAKTCKVKPKAVKIRWEHALTVVANLLGYHSRNFNNEATMIEVIVNDLLCKLKLTPKDFEDYVGVGDHISEMISLLDLESEEVRMVGMWGPSGIGKTTIARALYGRLSPHFQSSIFINRSFVSKSKEIHCRASPDDYNMKSHLQESFWSEILDKTDVKIDHLGAVRDITHQKVLIFIDDLDDQLVLDALTGQAQWFGRGSRIIVNTKEKGLLTAHGVKHIYEVCLPSKEVALEMFCQSAFRKNSPPEGLVELASEFALCAGNLPLSLNVLGSYLRGKDREIWVNMLPRLRNVLDGKVEKTLKVSYDGLHNKRAQALFRHIACFFNGEKVDDIKRLLADSNLDVNIRLNNLVDKSLVHVREGTVEMHHLLQDMAKDIVRRQSHEPGKRELLWDPKDICHVLENNTGTKKIKGISLDIDEIDELHVHEDAFKRMRNLQFLKIYTKESVQKKDVRWNFSESYDYLPRKLKLLHWDSYPARRMPPNFRPQNLVKLHMQDSNLEKLWEGVFPLEGLKTMDMRRSRYLKEIPDLSRAINLKTLRLNGCSSLVELPASIGNLTSLRKLDMSFCEKLETLPTGINLRSLFRLDLSGCSRLRSFPAISTNISYFNLSQTSIEEIPPNLRLKNLVDLCMEEMMSDKLWKGVQPLAPLMTMLSPSLTMLSLSNIQSLVELPSSFQNLKKLKELQIIDSKNLETLPTGVNLESLDFLDLSGCSRLKSFPNISTNISKLYLNRTAIIEVPWWIKIFTRLSCLHMNGCHNLQCVSLNIYNLQHLETVDFSDCRALTEVSWNDSPNMVAMVTDSVPTKLPVPVEASSPFPDDYISKVNLNLINCFNLDQAVLYLQKSVFFRSVELSGEEVPLYFTHLTNGTSLAIPLLQSSPTQQFFRFRACTLVESSESFLKSHIPFSIHVSCRFTDRPGNHFDSAFGPLHFRKTMSGSHLIIFDCCFFVKEDEAPLSEDSYYGVDIQFHLTSDYSQLKIKGCGVRVLEDSLLHDCEGDKGNEVNFEGHETKHSEKSGDSEECETDDILRDGKSDVNAKESQSVQGGKMFYLKSRSGDSSVDYRRDEPAKEQGDHGKVSESSTMVTYNKRISQHQVFINFWGEEVRFSFISHLVYALSTRGVNVFIDKYEKTSEDLIKTFQSIEDSKIGLVVFSSRYTESRWCLDELVKIKERMDEKKLLTIPIFYKVESSEVRQLKGDFGLKLWNLWRIHRDHRIIKWKEALECFWTLTDLCLKDHSSESKFISLITEEILSIISVLDEDPSLLLSSGKIETTKLHTGEGEYHESLLNKCPLFGMEQRMKQLEQKLEFDCNETRIIGVIGMPGIGKTTLAMMLHEKWNCKFVRCVPLLGIRKLSEYHEPEWLRKTLLEVLFGGEFQILNEKTTHESVKEKLLQTKVFVVLDDVSDKTQLKYLLDDLSWIKKGSRIVITSCDKSLIQEFVHDTYVIPPLKYGEALQLFSYHAFGDHVFHHPTVTSMKLCREFVNCAGGNPLIIKLLGEQLRGRDEAPWEMREGDLTHLGMMILDIFKFGYDLKDTLRDVFLDIACFFRSEDDNFVRSILDSGHRDATDAESEVRDLTHKGIISISCCRVEMHDLLYMFGKIYSSQALIEENGGKSRLWFPQEINDALVNQKDTESMRGIFLDMADITEGVLDEHAFINMPNLRYLKIYDSCCPRQCKAVNKLYLLDGLEFSLEKVRYLHWVNFPLEELPPDFRPENLVDLRLPYSKIERIWRGAKDTPWLKWVDLSHSENLVNLSGLAKAESLQRLNLEGCTNLAELPGEMQNMKSLAYLNLRGCIRILSLPEMDLTSLKTLVLSNCSNLKEFRVISKSLEVLHLDGTAIKGLPPSIGNLHSLVLFNMKNCKNLECLPNCLGQLKVLEELILSGCSSLKNIPAVRESMKHVQILLFNETGAKKMPKISCFTGPKGQASADMSSLRHLCLSGNDFVSLRHDIGKLYNLKWLDVKQCKKLRSIPMLPTRLQYLDANGCESLERVAHPLAVLAMTEQAGAVFNFSNCNKLTQEAKDNIMSYSRRRSQLMLGALSRYNEGVSSEALTRTCFPGGEVPEWFSHRGSGSVLEPQLPPQWCDSSFTGIALSAVILFPAYLEQRSLLVNCNCEFKKEDGSSIHFSFTVGSWSSLSNTPSEMESSHVFIGYTSRLDINKHCGYDEEGCFFTKHSFQFQVTDGTENVVGCQVLQCGFSLVYATDERENIFCDAKNQSYGSDLSENKGGEISFRKVRIRSIVHHNKPSEKSNTKIHDALGWIDQLNKRQKNVLFDLEDEYLIRSLLDSGNPDAVSEVRDLAEKFFIIICDSRVEMNDQLYMFAKQLGSPGRLRLWKHTDIQDKLRELNSLEEDNNVRGIFLDMSEVTQSIAMERMTFINMLNLRYLKIYETCCPGRSEADCKLQFPDGFDFPLKEVQYFHWLKFPLDELPRDFKPENLVDLRLPYSNVERLWEGVKDTPMLKWVDLSHSSKLLSLSGLAKAESLQRLNLEGCTNLDELPRDMQNMKSLLYLNMRGCTCLKSLPQMNLISLKTLILSDCSSLKEFQVISQSLEVLHLDGTVIKELPLAIQKLERLNLLNLKNCKMLESLPNCLGKLKLLEELVLSGCSRLKNLPDVRHSMKHVQTLLFDGTGVDEMPNMSCFIGSQNQVDVDISFLNVRSYCSNRVSSLRRLCLSGHSFVSLHNDIGRLYNLTWLDVKQCKKLRSVPMLPPRLEYFNAHGCDSLERVASPLGIQILTEQIHATFNFSNCNKLDPDATDAIISYTEWKSKLILDALSRHNGGLTLEASIGTCFPGWEVPAWFSHRASGYLLETKLPPHWYENRFTGVALCAVILFPGHEYQGNRLSVKCKCEFKSKDGSRIHFSCTVGGWIEQGNTIETSHVFLGYASKPDVRKFCEDNDCMHTDASFEFEVTDGTRKLEGYEVMTCGFSLVYASDELQVKSGDHGTNVETNQDITSSSWVQDFFGYIFLAFSCVVVIAILSFCVIVFAPQYYLSFSDFCWSSLARILFFVAFGLVFKPGHVRKRKADNNIQRYASKLDLRKFCSVLLQILSFLLVVTWSYSVSRGVTIAYHAELREKKKADHLNVWFISVSSVLLFLLFYYRKRLYLPIFHISNTN